MKISDLILDWITYLDIFDWLYQREVVIRTIRNDYAMASENLVKYLYYEAPLETKLQWKKDADKWLFRIYMMKFCGRKRLSPYMYYRLLFDEPYGEMTDIEGTIEFLERLGGMESYAAIITMEELHVQLEQIFRQISNDLAAGTRHDLEYYMNN